MLDGNPGSGIGPYKSSSARLVFPVRSGYRLEDTPPTALVEAFHRLSAVGNIMGRGAMWEMKSSTLRCIPSTTPSPPHPLMRVLMHRNMKDLVLYN